jgi:hypothetical protein
MPNLPQDMEQSGLLWIATGVWSSMALVAIALLLWRQGHWLWLLNTLSLVIFLAVVLLPAAHVLDYHRQQPLRDIAATVKQQTSSTQPLIMLAYEKPSIIFYSEQDVIFFRRAIEALYYMQYAAQQEPYPDSFLVLVAADQVNEMADLGFPAGSYTRLKRTAAYELIRIQADDVQAQPIACRDLPSPRRPFWEKGIVAEIYPTPAIQMLKTSECQGQFD